MPIRSVRDLVSAYDAGQYHKQRFMRNQGPTNDNKWHDWSFASGQPAYDARVGPAGVFAPQISSGNDAIWFPSIGVGQERVLTGMTVTASASGVSQTNVEIMLYDLLGVYPLIDGDSTDVQSLTNSLALPRYTNGNGVRIVLVNHIAPATIDASFTMNYTNSSGNAKSVTGAARAAGTTGTVAYSVTTLAALSNLAPFVVLDAYCKGVRTVDSIKFSSAPGGLWCIYLLKPLIQTSCRGGLTGSTQTVTTEYDLCKQNGFNLPRIYDGATLGALYWNTGGVVGTSFFGHLTFVWN